MKIPEKSSQIWMYLVTGEKQYRCHAMPASMMLAKAIRSVRYDHSPINIQRAIEELYTFFNRYQDKLRQDTENLSLLAAQTIHQHISRSEPITLPVATHPVWQALVSDQQVLRFNTMPAGMLLAKLIRSTQRDASSIANSARELHQFFMRYQDKMKSDAQAILELARQLDGNVETAPRAITVAPATQPDPPTAQINLSEVLGEAVNRRKQLITLPKKDDPVWRSVVTGRKPVECQSVIIEMMISRLIRSVERDSSEQNIQHCVDELYDTFFRFQSILQPELKNIV